MADTNAYTQNGRCVAEKEQDPGTALLGPVLGPGLGQPKARLRCRGEAGHDGPHWSWVQPFPGFADERVVWRG